MKASYRWLRNLVPDLSATPEELAARLTSAGLEVEALIRYGEGAAACLVAKVLEIAPHPTKAGLRLVTVDRGGATQVVVCGAPNVPDPGGLVVLAPLGATLPAKNMTIAPRSIAGVQSEGMLCSEDELGLTEDGEGILVLPAGFAAPGAPFVAALPEASDTIFEIGLTPNRPDCLGHIGLAREISVLYGLTWNYPKNTMDVSHADPIETYGVKIAIDDNAGCINYGAAVAIGATVGPSPLWLRYRLSSLGVRPINSIVDITNLVMLETGHPMHAFDLDKIPVAEKSISVRRALGGERLLTLDGIDRSLDGDDLVVCAGEVPQALAGVMGGKDSEISEKTTRILFECATFDPRSVRRAARRHSLHSESSHRFERGVDPDDVDHVLSRASAWASKLAGSKVAKGFLHAQGSMRFPRTARLRASRMRSLLGIDIAWKDALATLASLGCSLTKDSGASAEFEMPSHRPDLSREVDLIEEVIRVKGMDHLPEVLPRIAPTRDVGGVEERMRHVRSACRDAGLSEAIILAMTSDEKLSRALAPTAGVVLKNPLTQESSVLRTSLLPGLLDAASHACRYGQTSGRLYAAGPVFVATGEGSLPDEPLRLTCLLFGDLATYVGKPRSTDVWDLKGAAERLLLGLCGAPAEFAQGEKVSYLHPRGTAAISVGSERVGEMGPLHPDVSAAWELPVSAFAIALDLDRLFVLGRKVPSFQKIPRFPSNARDAAVVVGDTVRIGDLENGIRAAAGPLADAVSLFDRFSGGAIPEGQVSLAFRIVYRAEDRTLTDAEVDGIHTKVVADLREKFGAALRS